MKREEAVDILSDMLSGSTKPENITSQGKTYTEGKKPIKQVFKHADMKNDLYHMLKKYGFDPTHRDVQFIMANFLENLGRFKS